MKWLNPLARSPKQLDGAAAEERARAFLQAKGLVPVQANFRCKGGEIDLIMRDGEVLVFVEVRKRSGTGFGGAAASVTARKQARLILAAQLYLQRYRFPPACRFDVIAIDAGEIDWLRNAFTA
ncbi:MAG TPA: YraN family protein [Noviherbaspirillum sp.]|nr:YraN family protein [Noviherbaspirillum sp.]